MTTQSPISEHSISTNSLVFSQFCQQVHILSPLRQTITQHYRTAETELIPQLVAHTQFTPEQHTLTQQLAYRLANTLRQQKNKLDRAGLVQNLLQEFTLSSAEGIALMCLAEALLRIPDIATRDALIQDKIIQGDWQTHLHHNSSLFVNAATWGLVLTGKILNIQNNPQKMRSLLNRAMTKGGEPLIRKSVNIAMKILGSQFVTGQTIQEALKNARPLEQQGFNYSYDMLGEAALTTDDAQRYFDSYLNAIHVIGKAANGKGVYLSSGISIKLSALHPRYHRTHYNRVMTELYPKIFELAQLACQYDISLNIDAEESERLDISLDLLEKLCHEPKLATWNGIGFVIQAYQKRCFFVIDWLIDLAKQTHHRLMIRLVKGAYWDSEIKRTQVEGLTDYPLFTRKAYSDISYLACAKKLLTAPNQIYPQFATHNAQTLAAIYTLAGHDYSRDQYEFQCLHGMGESLYQQVVGVQYLNRACRIYAPVGTHETLLAYLVRRLLENGSNSSFVNQIADKNITLELLIEDPFETVKTWQRQEGKLGLPHPKIPLPCYLYYPQRINSQGVDLANEQVLQQLANELSNTARITISAQSLIDSTTITPLSTSPVLNPADIQDCLGHLTEASEQEIKHALTTASKTAKNWAAVPPYQRANFLRKSAELFEAHQPLLLNLLLREAGKTLNNAIAEIREAVDFLRYYAEIVEHDFSNDDHIPLGVVTCISPWNFPLAIFCGQIAAALAAGNVVLAKPASQTPLIAVQAVTLMHQAGIPTTVLQLLLGGGKQVGERLIADQRVHGVLFTGSTQVAKGLQRTLGGRLDSHGHPVPLIAETGGLNAMIVDSSALTEQVVNDVMISAFDSAGQRCSALRLLCLQEEIADDTLSMLKGAMQEYCVGNPTSLTTDIGPVIDAQAQRKIKQHIQTMLDTGFTVFQGQYQVTDAEQQQANGFFIPPTLIEIQRVNQLQEEIFGPVLHVIRFQSAELPRLIDEINRLGYGLTFGLHTRIDHRVTATAHTIVAGNIYVNRNIVGAIVGVQPFGGEGLSGTGPKAGGPLYVYRLLASRPANAIYRSLQRHDQFRYVNKHLQIDLRQAFRALTAWLQTTKQQKLLNVCQDYNAYAQTGIERLLSGPTGEENRYLLLPRYAILCIADNREDCLIQLAAILVVGSQVVWPEERLYRQLYHTLPEPVQERISFILDWQSKKMVSPQCYDGVIFHGEPEMLSILCEHIAQYNESIISVQGYGRGETNLLLERLMLERTISINTTAAGGNATLMTISE